MKVFVNHADVEGFRALVTLQLGFQFDDDKLDLLTDILRERMKVLGCEQYSAYEQHFSRPGGAREEMRSLAEHLTVCETFFFRYADHFRAFAEIVVPERMQSQDRRQQLRVLSAGCASGEEAYSLAILLRDRLPNLASWNISILGIDVNPSMVQKARRGIYSDWSLREIPKDLLERYFRPNGNNFLLDDSIRSLVKFEERNLIEEDPSFWHENAFDVVFCRNVSMYFTPEAARAVMARIARSLVPGGFLFLGHAETLRGISQAFDLRHTHDAFYYQRRKAGDEETSSDISQGLATNWPSPPYLPSVAEPTVSWFDVIQRSSERIVNLTRQKPGPDQVVSPDRSRQRSRGEVAPPPIWDSTLAIELLRKERFAEAMDILRTLPPESEADPDAQLLLAVLLANHGDLAEAEKVCQRLLQLDELNAGAHYVMALCREHAGDPDAAIEHDEAAVYLDSAFAMPHLHRGLVAKRCADMETARQQLRQAFALLEREDASRVLLFGGGFTREALSEFCRTELRACGGNA